jgi:hypothetical protein
LVELTEITFVRLPDKPSVSLVPGRYLYAGSAYGSGGLKARVSRHVPRAKPSRWHIDQLTETGDVLGAWIFPNGIECDFVDTNSALTIPGDKALIMGDAGLCHDCLSPPELWLRPSAESQSGSRHPAPVQVSRACPALRLLPILLQIAREGQAP